MYLRTVSLCMPNSRAIPRMDRPFSLALCTAFHLALCRGVGSLREMIAALRTLPPLLGASALLACPSTLTASGDASLFLRWLPAPLMP